MTIFYHEQLHRGAEAMELLQLARITICGTGALGANVAEGLARTGVGFLKLIDDDRIEERNLQTQPWERADVGARKARVLANALYRAVGTEAEAVVRRLDAGNVKKLLRGSDLVVDAFDNSVSRRIVAEHCGDACVAPEARQRIPCLHAGLAAAYSEVIWNAAYRVPSDAGDDVCDYPLARNLVTLTVAVACEAILAFLTSGEQRSYTVTLDDLRVQPYS